MTGIRSPAALRDRFLRRRRGIARARTRPLQELLVARRPTLEQQVLLLAVDDRHFYTHESLAFIKEERDKLIAERNARLARAELLRARADRDAAKELFNLEME